MLRCKFSGDYNSERIFKIGQYLTKLCVEHLGFTFLAHSVEPNRNCLADAADETISVCKKMQKTRDFKVDFLKFYRA